jgi:diguanylate cyclase (GGDEF)-like protein
VALRCYVAGVIFAGTASVVTALAHTGSHGLVGAYPLGFALLAVLLVCSEARPMTFLRLDDGSDITISWTFAFAIVLVAPAGALVAMWVASCLGDAVRRKPLQRILFNAAQMELSLCAALLVLQAPTGQDLLGHGGPPITCVLLLLGAAACAFLTNIVLTSVVLARHERVGTFALIRDGVVQSLSTDGMLLALAPVFAVAAAHSAVLVPLLAVAVWNVYRAANLALQRQHEATHDALTDLPNRREFFAKSRQALTYSERHGESFAIALLDLDGFKQINDQLGHQVGDLVLQEVANRLQDARRSGDVVGRLGGDEFAILLAHVDDIESAESATKRIFDALAEPLVVGGFPVKVGGSYGIAMYPLHGSDVDVLLVHADEAMYDAKRSEGSVPIRTASKASLGRLALLGDLERAISDHELVVHYQPKVDVTTRRVVGVEALLRWNHPRHGLIMPGEFMPLAEQTDLMTPLTGYVLAEALQQTARWHDEGLPITMAVNSSARNLSDDEFPALVRAALRDSGVAPQWLELEITENALLTHRARAQRVLGAMRDVGVSLAIDDFGTGYSSLRNLRDLPVSRIKIDKSFVVGMHSDRDDALIVASTVELAAQLGLTSIAEGVEDIEVMAQLGAIGCNFAQGYWIARPAPEEQIREWLKASFHGDLPIARPGRAA